MFPDCSGAATGDGVNDFAGRDETSSSELHTPRCTCVKETCHAIGMGTPRCIFDGNVSRDWYCEHVSRLFRCCRVVAGSGSVHDNMGVDGDGRLWSSLT